MEKAMREADEVVKPKDFAKEQILDNGWTKRPDGTMMLQFSGDTARQVAAAQMGFNHWVTGLNETLKEVGQTQDFTRSNIGVTRDDKGMQITVPERELKILQEYVQSSRKHDVNDRVTAAISEAFKPQAQSKGSAELG